MKSAAQVESRLLGTSLLCVWGGFALVLWNRYDPEDPHLAIHGAMVHAGVILLLHLLLRFTARHRDPVFLPLTSLLTGIGLVMLYDLKRNLMLKQCNWMAVAGAGLWLATLPGASRVLTRYKYTWMLLGAGLLLATSLFGNPLGSAGDIKLSLRIGSFSFQTSEIARLFLIVFLASFLSEKRDLMVFGSRRWWHLGRQDLRYVGPMLIMWGIAILFLVHQRDLGAALLFFGVFLGVLYMGNTRLIYVLLGIFLFCGGAYVCYHTFGHVRTRIDIWLNPWQDVENRGYQIVQSLFALGGGGLLGTGLGQGYSARVPAVHTDLIFSAIAEELGLAGSIAILIVFLLLVGRGFRAALQARDDATMLLAAGLAFSLGLQVCIIVGGATKMIPLTGVTLPFVSYGGSSLVANAILIGLLIAISHRNYQSVAP